MRKYVRCANLVLIKGHPYNINTKCVMHMLALLRSGMSLDTYKTLHSVNNEVPSHIFFRFNNVNNIAGYRKFNFYLIINNDKVMDIGLEDWEVKQFIIPKINIFNNPWSALCQN